MKNLFKTCLFLISISCLNYVSIFAQDEHKAFKEGDKIISIGINRGGTLSGNTNFAPTISYDYGLKGTRGIVSIGGFFSYSKTPYASNRSGSQANDLDSTYSLHEGIGGSNRQTFTAGLRLGLHYSFRKLDLYAGALIGFQKRCVESDITKTDFYKGIYPNAKLLRTEYNTPQTYCDGQFVFSPYVGARYYITKKVGIYLEAAPTTLSTGLSYKF